MQKESEEAKNLVYAWLKEDDGTLASALKDSKANTFQLKSSGFKTKSTSSKNVIGWIEGTDPVLKNEYIIITAHFDHVGVGKQGGGAFTEQDSIFNGARDNAMGTVGLLATAKSLAEAPPRRSVLILALTGEEMGLLGSRYYVEHPLIPLNQCVFNLNSDGAGYDDKEAISIIGYDRVGSVTEFDAAAKKLGLRIIPDPAPEQNLFDRSDNVSFAAKGIPAPSVSPGTTGFTDEIMKYYHQVDDNPDSVDFDYLLKYCKTFAHIARLVADKEDTPRWTPGDKYEEVGKELYNY
jgi:Zn-dependent M28 family amino/carboxypeptidase